MDWGVGYKNPKNIKKFIPFICILLNILTPSSIFYYIK